MVFLHEVRKGAFVTTDDSINQLVGLGDASRRSCLHITEMPEVDLVFLSTMGKVNATQRPVNLDWLGSSGRDPGGRLDPLVAPLETCCCMFGGRNDA